MVKKKRINSNSIMNILILGSGGREHTFAWKVSQSPDVNTFLLLPVTQAQLH